MIMYKLYTYYFTTLLLVALRICFGLKRKEEPAKLTELWKAKLFSPAVCNK